MPDAVPRNLPGKVVLSRFATSRKQAPCVGTSPRQPVMIFIMSGKMGAARELQDHAIHGSWIEARVSQRSVYCISSGVFYCVVLPACKDLSIRSNPCELLLASSLAQTHFQPGLKWVWATSDY